MSRKPLRRKGSNHNLLPPFFLHSKSNPVRSNGAEFKPDDERGSSPRLHVDSLAESTASRSSKLSSVPNYPSIRSLTSTTSSSSTSNPAATAMALNAQDAESHVHTLQVYQDTIARLQHSYHTALENAKLAESQVVRLNSDVAMLRHAIQELNVENEELANDLQDLLLDNEEMEESLRQLTNQVQAINEKNNQLRTDRDYLVEQFELQKQKSIDPEQEVENVKFTMKHVMQKHKAEKKALETVMTQLSSEKDEVLEQYQALHTEFHQLKHDVGLKDSLILYLQEVISKMSLVDKSYLGTKESLEESVRAAIVCRHPSMTLEADKKATGSPRRAFSAVESTDDSFAKRPSHVSLSNHVGIDSVRDRGSFNNSMTATTTNTSAAPNKLSQGRSLMHTVASFMSHSSDRQPQTSQQQLLKQLKKHPHSWSQRRMNVSEEQQTLVHPRSSDSDIAALPDSLIRRTSSSATGLGRQLSHRRLPILDSFQTLLSQNDRQDPQSQKLTVNELQPIASRGGESHHADLFLDSFPTFRPRANAGDISDTPSEMPMECAPIIGREIRGAIPSSEMAASRDHEENHTIDQRHDHIPSSASTNKNAKSESFVANRTYPNLQTENSALSHQHQGEDSDSDHDDESSVGVVVAGCDESMARRLEGCGAYDMPTTVDIMHHWQCQHRTEHQHQHYGRQHWGNGKKLEEETLKLEEEKLYGEESNANGDRVRRTKKVVSAQGPFSRMSSDSSTDSDSLHSLGDTRSLLVGFGCR